MDWDDNIISCFIAVNVEFEGEIMISEKWLTSDELATVVADENSITQIIEDIVAKAITILEKQKYTKARRPLIKDISTVVLPSEENIITKSSEYKDEFMGLIGQLVEKGTVVWYQGKLYRCIQSHTTQLDWTPDLVPTLWVQVNAPDVIPVWKQPTGAQDAYQTGDKVHFPTAGDPVYRSLIDANVWSPTEYPQGWEKL